MSEVLDRPEVADEVVGPAAAGSALSLVDPLLLIKAGLADLKLESDAATWDVETTKGEASAREFRARCVAIRTSADAAYERGNKPLLEAQRQARDLVKSIKASVEPIELAWDAKIKAKEDRKAREKAAREQAERERIHAIRGRIAAISGAVLSVATAGSAAIEARWLEVGEIEITEEDFAPFVDEAEGAKLRARVELSTLLARKLVAEDEERKLAEGRAELARQQAELAVQQKAAAELLAAEQRRLEEAAALSARMQAEERQRAEAAIAAERAEQQRRDDAVRAENKRIDDERSRRLQEQEDAFAAEKKAAVDKAMAEQAAERARVAAEQAMADKIEADRAAAAAAAQDAAEKQALAEKQQRETEEWQAELRKIDAALFLKPADTEILSVICTAYGQPVETVLVWLDRLDVAALRNEISFAQSLEVA